MGVTCANQETRVAITGYETRIIDQAGLHLGTSEEDDLRVKLASGSKASGFYVSVTNQPERVIALDGEFRFTGVFGEECL